MRQSLYSCSTGKLAMAGFFALTDKKTRSIIWTGILKVESLFSWDESGKVSKPDPKYVRLLD